MWIAFILDTLVLSMLNPIQLQITTANAHAHAVTADTQRGSCSGPGRFICSGSEDHCLYIWNVKLRHLVRVLSGHKDVLSAADWHPRIPGLIATASDDHKVKIWGKRSQRVLFSPPDHIGPRS